MMSNRPHYYVMSNVLLGCLNFTAKFAIRGLAAKISRTSLFCENRGKRNDCSRFVVGEYPMCSSTKGILFVR